MRISIEECIQVKEKEVRKDNKMNNTKLDLKFKRTNENNDRIHFMYKV